MLTDYVLALISLLFAIKFLGHGHWRDKHAAWLWGLGFAIAGAAAVVGGTFHGFASYFSDPTKWALWNTTVGLIGLSGGFMLSGSMIANFQGSDNGAKWLLAGIVVSAAGFGIQQSGVEPHKHFNHNDIYHCVQMLALYFLYRGAWLNVGPSHVGRWNRAPPDNVKRAMGS